MADGDKASFIVELIEKIRGPANRASNAVGKLMGRLEKARKDALSKTFETVKEMGTLAAIGAGAVAAGFLALTTSFADFAQRSELGFGQLAKHGASASKLFAHARNEAESLGLDVKDTTKTFMKFLALQFNPKQATDLIRMGADLQAFGTTAEGVERIMAQLGQIQAKGKLQGEELVVLAENGVSTQLVYEQLGKTLGKTKDEILKMQQAGKLSSDIALPAIQEAVKTKLNEKELGETGKKIANSTLSGIMGVLKAKAQNALTEVGIAIAPMLSEMFKPLADSIGAFIKDPKNIEAMIGFVSEMVEGIKSAVPFVKAFFSEFGSAFAEKAPEIFKAVGEALSFMGGDSKDMLTNTKLVARTLGELTAIALGAAVVFGGLLHAAFVAVSVVVQGAIGNFEGVVKTIGEALAGVMGFFDDTMARIDAAQGWGAKMVEIGRAIVLGLVQGINGLVNLPFEAIDNIASGIKNRLKSVLGIASPSTVFMGYGENVVQGFTMGLEPMNDVMAMGPIASSFADFPRLGEATSEGGAGALSIGDTVFQINQRPGQSNDDFLDDIETRVLRIIDQREERMLRAVGAA
jgi:tape measure domain-containing protein